VKGSHSRPSPESASKFRLQHGGLDSVSTPRLQTCFWVAQTTKIRDMLWSSDLLDGILDISRASTIHAAADAEAHDMLGPEQRRRSPQCSARLCVRACFRDPQSFMLKMANLIFCWRRCMLVCSVTACWPCTVIIVLSSNSRSLEKFHRPIS